MTQSEYQKEVYKAFEKFRPPADFPVYPPYHQGPYLEEYFCNVFADEAAEMKRIFIPVHWTNCYIASKDQPLPELQQEIDNLDKNYKYFIVSTHDDAPRQKLPEDTVCFSAGGNAGNIPIPLVCSSIQDPPSVEKDIFCSFMGSVTHPARVMMMDAVKENSKYKLGFKSWSPVVTGEDEATYKDIMSRSTFSLCPRGYGLTSYRLYEAMQLNSIPVYISDKFWLPWESELNWNEFCVLVPIWRLPELEMLLDSITPEQVSAMQDRMKETYDNHFTIPKVTEKIISSIKA